MQCAGSRHVTAPVGEWPSREPSSRAASIPGVPHKPLHSPARFHLPSPQAPDVGGSKAMGVQSDSPRNGLIPALQPGGPGWQIPLPHLQRSGVSSPRRLDGPGAAGGQIASPTNKLRLVEEKVESLGDQRRRGVAAAPGSEPCLLQLLAATRQIIGVFGSVETGVSSTSVLRIPYTPGDRKGRQREGGGHRLGRWTASVRGRAPQLQPCISPCVVRWEA